SQPDADRRRPCHPGRPQQEPPQRPLRSATGSALAPGYGQRYSTQSPSSYQPEKIMREHLLIQIFSWMGSADYDASRFRRGQVPINGILRYWVFIPEAISDLPPSPNLVCEIFTR